MADKEKEQAGTQPKTSVSSGSGSVPTAAGGGSPRRKSVEVICEGFLGARLLKKGDVTDDPEYVALVGDPRNLVRET